MKHEKIIIATIIGIAILGHALIGRQTKLDLVAEQQKIEGQEALVEQQEEQRKATKLITCTDSTWDAYEVSWINNCENHGFNIERDEDGITDCSLPEYNADAINKSLQEAQDRCVELYK